ncbi:MAG: subtilisin-like serine protease [Ignavibacteria bacterium]|nr:MAG: subtilisin-like serine protease [Ignavibacteria bacterium]KAF0162431.1 MAG: subtilisin-like serine protease [Ignavibacteria bacterium]
MTKRLLCLVLVFLSTNLFAQTKHYIYLKDKGVSEIAKLSKSSALYLEAKKELSSAAIERRKQVMGENYITYEDLPINAAYSKQIELLGINIENKLKWFNAVTAFLSDSQERLVKALPFVSSVEKVRTTQLIEPIDIKDASLQKSYSVQSASGLNYGPSLNQNALSEVPAVHDLGITGKGVLIGMLDTGFRWKTHPALKNLKIVAERDFIQKDDVTENQAGDVSNQDSHGTNCLGLMSGYDPGNLIGPAFDASIILAKTEDMRSETKAEEDNYAAAIEWMESQGVQITTSSLGYNKFDFGIGDYPWSSFDGKTTITAKSLNLAFERGVTTLTAAGNERNNSWGKIITPADAINVITVGAVDFANRIASFSSPGPTFDGRTKPEVVAMGVSNYISNTSGKYSTGNGTSFATPIAAGVAGLLKSAWTHLTNQQMRKIFLECSDNTNTPNNDRGWGLISAKRAVSYPNLKQENSGYRLNKIFINSEGVSSSSVKLNYKIGNGSFQTVSMNYDGTLKYDFVLPNSATNSLVEFFFAYTTTSGTNVREPADKNYKFYYGNMIITSISEPLEARIIPNEFELYQNYPNPFNPTTAIMYNLPVASCVTLKVYDVLGREVATLVNEYKQAGIHHSTFSVLPASTAARQGGRSSLVSGVYFYRIQAGSYNETKKMIILK